MVPITIVLMGFIKKVITGGHHLVENGSERTWDPLQGCAPPSYKLIYKLYWLVVWNIWIIFHILECHHPK